MESGDAERLDRLEKFALDESFCKTTREDVLWKELADALIREGKDAEQHEDTFQKLMAARKQAVADADDLARVREESAAVVMKCSDERDRAWDALRKAMSALRRADRSERLDSVLSELRWEYERDAGGADEQTNAIHRDSREPSVQGRIPPGRAGGHRGGRSAQGLVNGHALTRAGQGSRELQGARVGPVQMTSSNEGSYDPYGGMIASNIEQQRDVLRQGCQRALSAPDLATAQAILRAALAFHPMYAEDWKGWPAPGDAEAGR